MKNILMLTALNRWYDSIKEPWRFLLFFIAVAIPISFSALVFKHCPWQITIGMGFYCAFAIYWAITRAISFHKG